AERPSLMPEGQLSSQSDFSYGLPVLYRQYDGQAMSSTPSWVFREWPPVGVDFESAGSVADYDRNQAVTQSRDDAILDRLGVTDGTRVLDLGCGTGTLMVQAARRGAVCIAVDVSAEMIRQARHNSELAGVDVEFHQSSILRYEHSGGPVDVVTMRAVLHQLPDFWKQIALNRIRKMLKVSGLLYLWDITYSFDPKAYLSEIEGWLDTAGMPKGEGYSREDYETHVREEFSTFTWILETIIEKAGFAIVDKRYPLPVHAEYLCRAAG
ncbi:MAG TPA: methyltransferase domain-containing protein, partial [Acidimicrobiales bacterium]|nr:methyltransferase domain-containing protein [Acidimicrobiales bacterium]